ncbi:MAG: PatB family C-S lyase [Fuerstiella sp.]
MPQTNFNFDEKLERRGTGSIKWDRYPDYEPFWVADMDFRSPDCVVEAIHRRTDEGVFGYAMPHDGLVEAVLGYLLSMHKVAATADDLVHLPGMVPALSLACRAFTDPGDEVMICAPVYYPFFHVAKDSAATIVSVPHLRAAAAGADDHENTTWRFDWEAMEAAVTQKTSMLILCNPQNPLGRVFTQAEVRQLAEFCESHDLILISDEIHCDLVLDPQQPHFSCLNLPQKFQSRLVTLMAPSKTYNIAGLGYTFAMIPDDELRSKFVAAKGCTVPEINLLAMVAAEAAYLDGEPWRQDLIAYLRTNRDILADFVRNEIPQIIVHEHAATYLYWMDCTALNESQPVEFFAKKAGIYLTDGRPFGSRSHARFNFGCPQSQMLAGLEAMAKAVAAK